MSPQPSFVRRCVGMTLVLFAALLFPWHGVPAHATPVGSEPNRCGTRSFLESPVPLNREVAHPATRVNEGIGTTGAVVTLAELAERTRVHVGAAGGEAFLVEGLPEAPAVARIRTTLPVHEAYGLSADRAWFAYRPLDGSFPGLDLYVERVDGGALYRVTDDLVLEAAWSPADPDVLAYLYTAGDRFGLAVVNIATGRELARVAEGVHPDTLVWSEDGEGVHYLNAHPHVQNVVDPRTRIVLEQVPYVLLSPGYLPVPGTRTRPGVHEILPPTFPRLEVPRTRPFQASAPVGGEGLPADLYAFRLFSPDYAFEVLGDNLLGAGGIYLRPIDDDHLVRVAEGRLEAVLDTGLVIRTYNPDGSTLEFHAWHAPDQPVPLARSADVTYMIPMNQAWVTQTAVGYEPDCYSTHTGTMSYAYDFAYGSSGAHILASADGTVVYDYGSVTCNSCDNTDCVDYSSSCASNYGWGNVIILEHADGAYTMYTHLAYGSLRVSTGDYACAGLHIADQGHTGCAMGTYCGDHLHFQRQNGPYTSSQSIYVTFSDANNPLTCGGFYTSGLTEVSSCGTQPSGDSVVVDDLDSGFMTYGPIEYWWESTAGYAGHMYYTYVNGNDLSNYARWRPSLPGPGDYTVYAYVPDAHATTQAARYAIVHNRTVDYHTVNQNSYYNQWVSLGTYYFNGRGFEFVVLIDATGESTDTGRQIGFDAVKFTR